MGLNGSLETDSGLGFFWEELMRKPSRDDEEDLGSRFFPTFRGLIESFEGEIEGEEEGEEFFLLSAWMLISGEKEEVSDL